MNLKLMMETRPAFTLIEMVVVMAVIGFMAATILPRMLQRTPKSEWPVILADLNDLVFFARQEAISSQAVRRLLFKHNEQQADTVTVQEEVDDPDKPGKKIWRQVYSYYAKTKYVFHESIKLKGFFHGHQNDLEENKGEGCCYIVPDGLVEDVVVQFVHAESVVSFKLSPFFGTWQQQEGL